MKYITNDGVGEHKLYRLYERKFVVVDFGADYTQCLGVTKDRLQALGIAFDFLNEFIEREDVARLKPVEINSGYGGEEYIALTLDANTSHNETIYDIRILYLNKFIKNVPEEKLDKLKRKHPDWFDIRKRTCRL